MKIIDVHCHLLPGLDDGAADLTESKELLDVAFDQGIRGVIATPHFSAHFCKARPEVVRQRCEELQIWAQEELDPDFFICPGQEIFAEQQVLEKLEGGELLTLAGSGYILVEFHPAEAYSTIYRFVRDLSLSPYRPVLAHVERYQALRKKGHMEELIRSGALMQMNYRPVGGSWYDETTRWCHKMLKEGNIHFLGTDMHHTIGRAPSTEAALRWMQKNLDEEYLDEICWKNAEDWLMPQNLK